MYHFVVARLGRVRGNVLHVYDVAFVILLHRSLINRFSDVRLTVRQFVVGDVGDSMTFSIPPAASLM